MKLNVVGIQNGPFSSENQMEQLAASFDSVIESVPHVDIVVFSELMTLPYFCKIADNRYFDLAEPLDGQTFQFFSQKAKDAGVFVIITIFEKCMISTNYYNTAIVISDKGERLGYYRKTHIPKIALPTLTTDESLYFTRGNAYPVFEIKGYKVGILICFDRSFPEAARALALQGADVIVIPTAAGGEERKNAWLAECQARARENGVYVVGVNRAGEEEMQGIASSFFGLTCAFGPNGVEVVPPLASEPWTYIQLEVDHRVIEDSRKKLNFLSFLQGDLYHGYSEELQKIRNDEIPKETVPLFGPKEGMFHD